MSDSHDKSDDLIAELAKLMASGAAGAEGAPKPTVIKLPPLDEATIKAAPVRIPGMDSPAVGGERPDRPAPAASAGPAVRIPGMDRPVGVNDKMPTAPAPRPGSQFDFGKPSPPVSRAGIEPFTGGRDAPKPTPQPPEPTSPKIEPVRFGAAPQLATASAFVAPAAQVPEVPRPSSGAPGPQSADEALVPQDGTGGGAGVDDPIADLITRELDEDHASPATDAKDDAEADFVPPAAEPAPPPVSPTVVQIRPVSVAARQPDGDRFAIAPAFAGDRRTPTTELTPRAGAGSSRRHDGDDSDPMDEIENLIGEAVRVELSAPERPPAAGATAPVVPPLNTSFGPRRSGLRDREPQVESAEAAILAAASEAEDGELGALNAGDRPYKRMRVKPPRTSMIPGGARQYVGIAVAGTLLLASGFGLYWVLGMNRGDPTEAPVLTADVSPTKVEPSAPAVTAEPTSGSVVFDEIDGVANAGAEEEALVSRDETAGASAAEVARAVTPPAQESDDVSVADTGLANRKVRTVTVRPDGTIVASDDTVAGTSELPIERPNVPEIADADAETSDLLTAAVAETRVPAEAPASGAGDPLSALVAETAESDVALETPDPIDVAALSAAEVASPEDEAPPVFDGSLVAPVPMPRPFSREAMIGGGGSQGLALAPVSAPATTAPTTTTANSPASVPLTSLTQEPVAAAPSTQVSSRGGAYVQLSSQPSESQAMQSLRSLQSSMAGLLNGASLEIRQVELPGRGTWYRVALPVSSFQDATRTCATIKANGGDCVAING